MIRVSLMAGVIGRDVGDVVSVIQKTYPARRVVSRERREPLDVARDPRRINVLYDSPNGIVYDIQEG